MQVNDPALLPSTGAGFADFTGYPKIIAADKTPYIAKLDRDPKYQAMFLRPRRFGKSTFLETLIKYYDKCSADEFDDIFGDLYIGKNRTPDANSLLVLRFNFSAIPVSDSMERSFNEHMHTTLERFLIRYKDFLLPFDQKNLLTREHGATSLFNVLYLVGQSKEKLFVGVDEYDAPANSALFSSNPTRYSKVAEFFQSSFFTTLKDGVTQDIVQKYWLTGVLPAFRDGITPLTATHIISRDPEYHGLCGLTDTEVETIAQAYLGSEYTPETLEKVMTVLREWYNGYQFCPSNDIKLERLYNPQLVFTHLRDMKNKGQGQPHTYEPKDEIEAIHSMNVLKALPNEGETSFVDMFVRVASGTLTPDIHYQLSGDEFRQRNSNTWVSQTLLYFFGVFSYASRNDAVDDYLRIPNKTMIQMLRRRFHEFLTKNKSLAQQIGVAKRELAYNRQANQLVNILEAFLQPRSVRAVRYLNEDGLRTTIEALWFDPTNKSTDCIAELCLVANPNLKRGQGRYNFVDIYFPSSSKPIILELKNASLEGISQGQGDSNDVSDNDLVQLRETLKKETTEELLRRNVKYRKNNAWVTTTIENLKNDAYIQVNRYMGIMKNGLASPATAGVEDWHVKPSTEGAGALNGYAVICVGGTRVLAWHVKKESVKECCLAIDLTT
ncbi:DUF1703-domain-containing protein [Serendipita vermifera]|nr:DUF1703-domain-containing protein [Serendipita vermifera]